MGMPLDASWKSINGRLDLGQLVQAYQLHHAEENKQIKPFSDKKCHCSFVSMDLHVSKFRFKEYEGALER